MGGPVDRPTKKPMQTAPLRFFGFGCPVFVIVQGSLTFEKKLEIKKKKKKRETTKREIIG